MRACLLGFTRDRYPVRPLACWLLCSIENTSTLLLAACLFRALLRNGLYVIKLSTVLALSIVLYLLKEFGYWAMPQSSGMLGNMCNISCMWLMLHLAFCLVFVLCTDIGHWLYRLGPTEYCFYLMTEAGISLQNVALTKKNRMMDYVQKKLVIILIVMAS
jgi:hypothetical protein